MSTPSDPPTSCKKTASILGATKLHVPTVHRATSMTTCQAQRTTALNLTGTQPTTVTYNEPTAVETPQIIEGGTPAATLASDDAASVQDSLPSLQTVSNSSDSNVTSSVDAEGVNPQDLIAKAGAARAILVSSIKRATSSRVGGSPPGNVEVEAAVPPSVVPEASLTPKNGVETRVADTPVSAVRIADERTPPDSVVGTEPGMTPTPSSTCSPSDYDSITAALLAGCGHPRIFVSLT
jgi:hypothetical protein